MRHRFYHKTQKQQKQIQLFIAIGSFLVILLSFLISWLAQSYLFGILAFSIVLSIIAPFFDTPSSKKSGNLIYHSPLFLSEKPKNAVIKIHGGTLFDYVFVIDKKMNGKQRTSFILQQYIQGLLNLTEKYENLDKDDIVVRGTSYIWLRRNKFHHHIFIRACIPTIWRVPLWNGIQKE